MEKIDTWFGIEDGSNNAEKPFDAFKWVSYFAFDVMNDMTYRQRHGFIEKGEDVYGIIGWVESFLAYAFVVRRPILLYTNTINPSTIKSTCRSNALGGQILRAQPIVMWLQRQGLYAGNTFPGVNFALHRIAEREQKQELTTFHGNSCEDMLDKFRKAKQKRPEHMTKCGSIGSQSLYYNRWI